MAVNGGKVIDYFAFSKAAVDKKFLEDMREICDAQIPAGAKVALKNCKQNGGFHLVSEAKSRYNLVAATSYSQMIWKGLGFYQEPPRHISRAAHGRPASAAPAAGRSGGRPLERTRPNPCSAAGVGKDRPGCGPDDPKTASAA